MKASQISRAFTLIELLVVIAILAILMGLLFPAANAVKESARKTQAKNDETQTVNAIKAYYTEYGKYPNPNSSTTDYTFTGSNDLLYNILRGWDANINAQHNPRQIVFMEVAVAKDTNNPRSGLGGNGSFYDPWGTPYNVAIDGDYDNKIVNPYGGSSGAGWDPLNTGAVAYSFGKDKGQGKAGDKKFKDSDDVISWQ